MNLVFILFLSSIFAKPQPSLECSQKLNPLFIKQIGYGAQGTVYKGPNNIVIKRIWKYIFEFDGRVNYPNYEKEILEKLNELISEGKATGFVKLIDAVKCGRVQYSSKERKYLIDPSAPIENTYLIMEELDDTLENISTIDVEHLNAYFSYFAQTLTALDVAYKEKRFVSRDLHLNNIMTVKDFKTCSESYGYYRYQMPDLTLDIPRSYSCGKNIKIIDVGLSAIDDKKGKRISYMKEGSIPKEHLADLFSVALNFLTPNLEFFENMKEKRPEVYEKLNDLYQHIFHPNQIPFIMAQYGLRRYFKVHKKFDIIAWKVKFDDEQQKNAHLKILDMSNSFLMKEPWFTVNDAIHHQLFRTLFEERMDVNEDEIKIIGKTEKYVEPFDPEYKRKLTHRLAHWYYRNKN